MEKSGLVLEGGGMRGMFTVGVLDFFLDNNIDFKSCFAVSAGAGHACSFLSKQRGRAYNVTINYVGDKRYCSLNSLVKTGDIFGAEFIYETIPKKLCYYDYETFRKNDTEFYTVVTNCTSGEAEYIKISDLEKDMVYVRASSSLPLLSRMVNIEGKEYLDGGVTDSIPIKEPQKRGIKKNVIVLTQHDGYRKKPMRMMTFVRLKYKKYPNLCKSMENRYIMYNETLDYIKEQEEKGNVFVIRPENPLNVGRIEKDPKKLDELYRIGYEVAEKRKEELMAFLEK